MNFTPPKRLSHFQTGIFADLNEKKEDFMKTGRKMYNLFIGTPDFPVSERIRQALIESAGDPENWHYTLMDTPEMLQAVKEYYKRRFGVTISTDEIMSVSGSQEGVAHLGLSLCDPGDLVLLPDPGYPVFEVGAYLGGAELYFYELREENNFLPNSAKAKKLRAAFENCGLSEELLEEIMYEPSESNSGTKSKNPFYDRLREEFYPNLLDKDIEEVIWDLAEEHRHRRRMMGY